MHFFQFQATFENLEPCTNYVITANAYLGKREDQSVIFEGHQEEIEVKTMPNMTNPFQLKTLRANITGTAKLVFKF